MTCATAAGSSYIGMWPQPGSRASTASTGSSRVPRHRRRSRSRSRLPKATVVGGCARPSSGRPIVQVCRRLERGVEPGATGHFVDGGAGLVRGDPGGVPVRLPQGEDATEAVVDESVEEALGMLRQRPGSAQAQPAVPGVFPDHMPAGESRVSVATGRSCASSSATQPPSEFPTTCGSWMPASLRATSTAAARAAGVACSDPGGRGMRRNRGDRPRGPRTRRRGRGGPAPRRGWRSRGVQQHEGRACAGPVNREGGSRAHGVSVREDARNCPARARSRYG